MSTAPAGQQPKSVIQRISVGTWIALVLVVLAIVFIAQNRNRVTIDIFWIDITAPLWLVMTAMFAVGVVTGLLIRKKKMKQAPPPTSMPPMA